MKPAIEAVDRQELERILEHVRSALSKEEYQRLKAAFDTLVYVTQLVENKNTTIARLRQILFGASTEKTAQVLKAVREAVQPDVSLSPPEDLDSVPSREGHGRNGAQAYVGATQIKVPHPSLNSGELCPECRRGKVYPTTTPGVLVRVVGQAPLAATVYELQKLRCNLCLEVFTAPAPEGIGSEKYDAGAASIIALLKYGSGVPFHRLEGLQESLGIPLPASTQWEIAEKTAAQAKPAFEELCPSGGAGRDPLQRRYHHEDPRTDGGTVLERSCRAARDGAVGTYGDIYLGHRVDARGAHPRAVLHRPQARRREPE